ncbi:MAG TPA: TIGR03435 family protein, partial [Bryobacteraceae bacterium]|nr:TIGR03435 family protein [Bryobacteraceae bacterium]
DFQVEGPDWLDGTRFDITAKLPAGASEKEIPEMLQSLLASRLHLSLHRETKAHAIYALVVAKGGPRLKPAENQVAGSGAPHATSTMQMDASGMHLKATATLASLGEMIARFSERPVVDMTRIQGLYDFDLVFSPETLRGVPAGGPGGPGGPPAGVSEGSMPGALDGPGSIFDSVDRYGLKLEARKAPMEILVVDGIEKTPTEN